MAEPHIVVIFAATLLVGVAGYTLFHSAESATHHLAKVREFEIVVRGGYFPSIIRVQEGVRLRLRFNRQEADARSALVLFPDFRVRQTLPAFATTTVELTTERSGRFAFVSGKNEFRGTVIVDQGHSGRRRHRGRLAPVTVPVIDDEG